MSTLTRPRKTRNRLRVYHEENHEKERALPSHRSGKSLILDPATFVSTGAADVDLAGSDGVATRSGSQRTGKICHQVRTASLEKPDSRVTNGLAQQLEAAADIRRYQLNLMPPLLEGWEIAGSIGGPSRGLNGGIYDWSVREDGSLCMAVGFAEGSGLIGALSATSLLAAHRSHVCYSHQASELLNRLNGSLWTGSTGGQFASFWCGHVCPRTGHLTYSVAGTVYALWLRADRAEWLELPTSERLGEDPDAHFAEHDVPLARGEQLVVLATDDNNALTSDELNWLRCNAQEKHGRLTMESANDVAGIFERWLCDAKADGLSVLVLSRRHP